MPFLATAQQGVDRGVVAGTVRSAVADQPVRDAAIQIGDRLLRSDAAGRFVLGGLASGPTRLRVEAAGFAARELTIDVPARDTVRLFLRLAVRSVQLERVVVTATEERSREGGSHARIGRDAIEHVQASSLADLLQLVPGQQAVNPTLAGPRQLLLRQAPTTRTRGGDAGSEADRTNALGTAIVLDGVPVSNNANLQTTATTLNSGAAALPTFASTAGRGTDLRQIPADNIESIEVIRGIPSARHGDLTAGAVLVRSRAGAQAPELRVRANPQTIEVATVAGWGTRVARRGISADGLLTTSQDDPRSTADRFTRVTSQVAWTERWRPDGRLQSTVRVRAYSSLDDRVRDPDDARQGIVRFARDRGLRADVQGAWQSDSTAAWRVEWLGSTSVAEQSAYAQQNVSRDIFPVSRMTRDTTAPAEYGRSQYVGRESVHGRPLNVYARLEATGRGAIGSRWRHEPLAGMELRHDVNRGAGRVVDPAEPPRQNFSVGERPRAFRDVPGMTIVSAYLEDRVRGLLAGRALDVQAGVRGDVIDPRGLRAPSVPGAIAPRVNAQLTLRDGVRVRGGAGVTVKAPTLAQRYPLPRWFDLVNFNYFAQNPAERLVIVTTRRLDARPTGLRAPRATKAELGLDLRRGAIEGSVVAFRERTSDAIGTTRVPVGLPVERLRAIDFPVGRPPVLAAQPAAVDTFIGAVDVPGNGRRIDTRGVEFTLEIPEWQAVRTALSLSGGWFDTRATETVREIDVDRLYAGGTQPERLPVYDAGSGSQSVQFVTSARFIHRLPEAGLLLSLLAQVTWQDADRPLGIEPEQAVAYVDRGGRIVSLTPQQAASPEFAGLARGVPQGFVLGWERRPPLPLFNLRVTKTLPARSQLALFVNNALADRPLFQPVRTAGFVRRNIPLFFGVEFVAALAGGAR
ncbi:MAG: TonB-dependent receptor [Gemmatimonadaceae bacterium]|nr:TonB-dependent receptor [Gemmatimonadaceae bacterium]